MVIANAQAKTADESGALDELLAVTPHARPVPRAERSVFLRALRRALDA